jgi:hypothetical protein
MGRGGVSGGGPVRPIERYARCSVDIPGGSVELGVAYERNEFFSLPQMRASMIALVRRAVAQDLDYYDVGDHNADRLSEGIETSIRAVMPDGHAWFVEVWNATECLTQVYQPYGMPITKP